MTTARKYAEGTAVGVDRTVAEIQRLVKAHGGRSWRYEQLDDQTPTVTRIGFVLAGWPLRFQVTAPTRREMRTSPAGGYRTEAQIDKALDDELRRRWREVFLLVKANLIAIASGVVTAQQALLPYVVLEDEQTVADYIVPRLAALQAAAQGRDDIRLLPPVSIEEVS